MIGMHAVIFACAMQAMVMYVICMQAVIFARGMQAMALIDTWYVSANKKGGPDRDHTSRRHLHYFCCSFIVAKLLQNMQCMTAE